MSGGLNPVAIITTSASNYPIISYKTDIPSYGTYNLWPSLIARLALPSAHVDFHAIGIQALNVTANVFTSAGSDVLQKLVINDLSEHITAWV